MNDWAAGYRAALADVRRLVITRLTIPSATELDMLLADLEQDALVIEDSPIMDPQRAAVLQAALRLASEAETVCDLWGGDKSVDALRASLSAFCDAYDTP